MLEVARPRIGAGVEVTRRAGDLPIAAGLNVPEQGLAEQDRCALVDDVWKYGLGSGDAG
jgi:hypothetical protein